MCVCVSVVNLIIHYRNKLFYNRDDEVPVYRWNGSNVHYSLDSLADVLLNHSVSLSCVCSKQPVHVCHNVSFVVDLEKLEYPTDRLTYDFPESILGDVPSRPTCEAGPRDVSSMNLTFNQYKTHFHLSLFVRCITLCDHQSLPTDVS